MNKLEELEEETQKRPRRKVQKQKKEPLSSGTTALAHQNKKEKRKTPGAHDNKRKKRAKQQHKEEKEASSSIQTKKKKQQKPSKASSATTAASAGRRHTALRIQREWRDAVEAGIAFDWNLGQPVALVRHEKKKQKKKQLQRKRKAKLVKQKQNDVSDATTTDDTDTDNETDIIANSTTFTVEPQHVWLGPVSLREWRVWHFSFQGLPGSVYEEGVYHGRLVLPRDYPAHPPRVQVLTPSGRFVPGADLCLSASSYHPETWQPAQVQLRTLVEGVRLHMLANAQEIGGIATATYDERLALARASREFHAVWRRGALRVDHAEMLRKGWIRSAAAAAAASTTTTKTPSNVKDGTEASAEVPMSVGENNTTLVHRNDDETEAASPPALETTAAVNVTQRETIAAPDEKGLEDGVSVAHDVDEDDGLAAAVSEARVQSTTTSSPTARKSAPSLSKQKRNKKKKKRHHSHSLSSSSADSSVKRQTARTTTTTTTSASTVTTTMSQQPTSVVVARILQKHARWLLLSFCALFLYLNR